MAGTGSDLGKSCSSEVSNTARFQIEKPRKSKSKPPRAVWRCWRQESLLPGWLCRRPVKRTWTSAWSADRRRSSLRKRRRKRQPNPLAKTSRTSMKRSELFATARNTSASHGMMQALRALDRSPLILSGKGHRSSPRFRIREPNPVCDNSLTHSLRRFGMPSASLNSMQVARASTVAIGTSFTSASSSRGASAIENSVAPEAQGASQFADGLQALLSAGGPDSGTGGGTISIESVSHASLGSAFAARKECRRPLNQVRSGNVAS